ncbi:MAG: STAS domain-containing protein [Steroidobacteraceae bacterium]
MSTPGGAVPAAPQASAGAFRLVTGAGGALAAQGALTFATARQARHLGLHALSGAGEGGLQIDCGGITVSDSAGLAVLLDWLAAARAQGRSLRLARLPEGLTALARISEVDELLSRGV